MRPMEWARGRLTKAIPSGSAEPRKSEDAIKTYRYLRIGMIGAVVLLATSIAIERSKVDCWQTSISAYYYTPVRAIFVGSMIAVGLVLIVYKGRGLLEDFFLNMAGMLAPVVAVAPTTDIGRCWSVVPSPRPLNADGTLADWVAKNIDNNVYALLIAGGIGLVVALIIAIKVNRGERPQEERVDRVGLVVTAVALIAGWLLIRNWSGFDTRAHGLAAILLFVFLIVAIVAKTIEHRSDRDKGWFKAYATIAILMIIGAILIWAAGAFWEAGAFKEHTVLILEAYEITFFAVYWIAQTVENWNEKVVGSARSGTAVGGS